jgi:hypothetical protein
LFPNRALLPNTGTQPCPPDSRGLPTSTRPRFPSMPSRPQSILGLSAVPFPRRNPSSSPRRRAVRCPSPRLRAPSLLPSHLMFFSRNAFRDLDPIDSPASMASSKKVATRDEWERKLRDVKIRKEDMNRLVMNFLVTEGFVDAADKFRIESGTQRITRFTLPLLNFWEIRLNFLFYFCSGD